MSHWKHLLIAAALVAAAIPAWAGEATSPAPTSDQIAAWIKALDAEDYATREEAGKNLVAAGRAAVPPVAQAILSDSPEKAWRANDVLEQIGIAGDEQTLELVSKTLDEVSKSSKHSLAKSTSDVQHRWKLMRHERAVEQITKLGGHVRGGFGEDGIFFGGGGFAMIGGPMMMPALPVDFDVGPVIIEEGGIDVELPPPTIEEGPAIEAPKAEGVPAAEADAADPRPDAPPGGAVIKDIDAIVLGRLKAAEFKVLPADIGPRVVPLIADLPAVPAAIEEHDHEHAEPPKPAGGFFDGIIRGLGDLLPLGKPELFEPAPVDEEVRPVIEAFAVAEADAVFLADGIALDMFGMVSDGAGGSHMVRLDKQWKGGVEGFKLLRDVMQLNMLELHELELTSAHLDQIQPLAELRQLSLQKCRFDRASLAKLKEARPELNVLAFGDAVLGISGDAQPGGFQVSMVNPGSGAEAAGLQVGDLITTIDGEELRTFERLTHIIASHTKGDTLKVAFSRGGKSQTVVATLGAREATP